MKISKTLAESIAKQALSNRSEEVKSAKAELSILATQIAWARVPKEVKAIFEKHRKYMAAKRSSQFYTAGRAQDYALFQFTEKVPYNSEMSCIQISEKQHDELFAFKKKGGSIRGKPKKRSGRTGNSNCSIGDKGQGDKGAARA